MAGHVEDRWWRVKRDPATNTVVTNAKGKPEQEKTDLHGKGKRYRVHYYDAASKERSRSFPDGAKGKAEKFLLSVQHDVLTGTFLDPTAGEMTFKAYAQTWLKGQTEDAKSRETMAIKLGAQLYPTLGELPLKVVERPDTVRDWLGELSVRKLSGTYRAALFDLLSSILGAAVDDQRIRSNPCRAKSIKRPKPEERKVVPMAEHRLEEIKAALPDRYRVVVPMGAGLALRQMEILGGSPDDLDRDAMVFHVNRQIRYVGGVPVFSLPKGGKTRTVPLSPGVLERIDAYMEAFESITVTLPWAKPGGDPVTVRLMINYRETRAWRGGTTRDKPWRGGHFLEEVWQPAFQSGGAVYRPRLDGMHAMRHFCASHWLANGVSIKEVAEYLGHSDPGYTLRVYTHLVPSSHERARHAIDKVFPPDAA